MTQEIKDRTDILRKTQIFRDASDEVIGQLAERLKPLTLQEDETLFFKGEKGHAMYIIESGKVRVHDGEHVFDTLGEGEVFGEYSLIDTEVRSASITGESMTELLRLDRDSFYELMSSNKEVLQGILMLMVARLRNLDIIQEELAQKNRKIEKQKEEIEVKNAELINLNEEKNHLISIVAHDIRNPLSSASTFASLLKSEEEELNEEHKEYVTHLERSLARMTDLVTRILDVKAIESKYLNLKLAKFNVQEEMEDILAQFGERAEAKNITIEKETVDFEVLLDPGLFRQIAENLITNAIKFSPSDRKIWVRIHDTNEDEFHMEVQDEGPGFSEKDKEKLFGRFQQLSAKPTGGESSTGLGLSIVKKFTESLKGEIVVESESGKGAKFTVRLPKYLKTEANR